jgi:ankyrin repeat protein
MISGVKRFSEIRKTTKGPAAPSRTAVLGTEESMSKRLHLLSKLWSLILVSLLIGFTGLGASLADNDKTQAMIDAAWRGDAKEVERLLAEGADINKRGNRNRTALMLAAGKGHLEVVKLLLDKGAEVESKKDNGGLTALFFASVNDKGHPEIIKLLVSRGADPNVVWKNPYPMILHYAVMKSSDETVRALLENGANPNAVGAFGETALTNAATEGRTAVAEMLVAKGANINTKDANDLSPIAIAAMEGHTGFVKFLRERGANESPENIFEAAALGRLDTVKQFLDNGSDVNATTGIGNSALEIAARSGQSAITEFLISKGAIIGSNEDGWTALSWAAEKNRVETLELLFSKAAPINDRGSLMGSTALCSACSGGATDAAKFLLSRGADVNHKCNRDFTPLHKACSSGSLEIVNMLLERGADVNARSENGFTPLKMIGKGRCDIRELLQRHGAKE